MLIPILYVASNLALGYFGGRAVSNSLNGSPGNHGPMLSGYPHPGLGHVLGHGLHHTAHAVCHALGC